VRVKLEEHWQYREFISSDPDIGDSDDMGDQFNTLNNADSDKSWKKSNKNLTVIPSDAENVSPD